MHLEVQNSLARLALWFEETASSAENAEGILSPAVSCWKPGTLQTSHTEVWNLGKQLRKKSVQTSLSGQANLAAASATWTDRGTHHSFQTRADLLNFSASGTVRARLWDKSKFNPEVKLNGEASMTAASVSGNYRLFSGSGTSASLNVKGEAGAVYAKAQAVVSASEQSLDLAVGAAVFRGECSLAFSLLGCSVTITGQGSVGSCEASVSYHHRNREWEFGSKLGFIAGTGFKIKVNY